MMRSQAPRPSEISECESHSCARDPARTHNMSILPVGRALDVKPIGEPIFGESSKGKSQGKLNLPCCSRGSVYCSETANRRSLPGLVEHYRRPPGAYDRGLEIGSVE